MNLLNLYSTLPVFAQNMLCAIKGYQLSRERYGSDYEKIYSNLLQSEHASVDTIRAYKEENIHKILTYAYSHCPYYTHAFKSVGLTPSDFKGLDDLQKFPKLTKEIVRNNWKGMISDEVNIKDLISYHTSGSTGKALDFYWTRNNLKFYWATVWRARHRCGIEKGDLHLNFTGKLVVPLSQNRPPYWRYNRAINQYMLNMQHIVASKIEAIVDFINNHDFRFIVGYPSIINAFAQLVEDSGLQIKRIPLYMFPSAEKLYENQAEQILRVFSNIKIMEHYGFSENAACASTCLCGNYHEDYELGHLELDNPVKTEFGKTGILLATGFQNFGMPFIRYEIGDTATFREHICECGLHSQVIVDIEGRNEDYIITPEGSRIMRFDYIFKNSRSIKECQVIQRELGEIILRIVCREDYSKKTEQQLINSVHEQISPALRVSFEYVDEIPRTKAGKFRAVISELQK